VISQALALAISLSQSRVYDTEDAGKPLRLDGLVSTTTSRQYRSLTELAQRCISPPSPNASLRSVIAEMPETLMATHEVVLGLSMPNLLTQGQMVSHRS
jgi:hypothetical protein